MNRKRFIQDAVKTMILFPEVMDQPREKRLDFTISMAEAMWEKLKERGYGDAKQREPSEKRHYYSELEDKELFDKCWFKYGKEGAREAAAKAWLQVEETEKEKIFPAICSYLDQLGYSKKAKAHFSTWINERRWESFEKSKTVTEATKLPDPLEQQIKHYESLIRGASKENKTMLEAQLQALKERQRVTQ